MTEAGTAAPIRLSGLGRDFVGHLGIGRKTAVDSLDLEVERGEIFGLLGRNGAGKTTTIKMILGLLRPDRGEALIFGIPSRMPRARASLGYLPEKPYFYDYLTTSEFLDFYGRLNGLAKDVRKRQIDETLARVGLAGEQSTQLRKLSKGMTQRLGLAQAIQHEPDLVILDEPMSGLDPIGRREIRDLILDLKRQGCTVFFSSHILQDAEMICDRVAILEKGRVQSIGRLDELVTSRVHWIEVEVEGVEADRVEGQVLPAGGDKTLLRVADMAQLTRLITQVEAAGGNVMSVFPRRDSLEDLFVREVAEGGKQ